MNLPFFAVEPYVPGQVQNQAEKKIKKCLPAGADTKIYFPALGPLQEIDKNRESANRALLIVV